MSFAELESVFLFWELPGGRRRWAGWLGGSNGASWPYFARTCLGPSGVKMIVGNPRPCPDFVTTDMVREKVFTHLHELILKGRCSDLVGLEKDLHGVLGIVGPQHLFQADCGMIGVDLLRIVLCRPEVAQALVIDPENDSDEEGNDERLPSILDTVLARCEAWYAIDYALRERSSLPDTALATCEALAATATRECAQRQFFILEIGKLLQPLELTESWWGMYEHDFEKLNEDPKRANRLFMCLEFLARLPPYGEGLKGGEPDGIPVWPDNPATKKAYRSLYRRGRNADWPSVRRQSLAAASELKCKCRINTFKLDPPVLIRTVMEKYPEEFSRCLAEKEPQAAARIILLTLGHRERQVEKMLRLFHPKLFRSSRRSRLKG